MGLNRVPMDGLCMCGISISAFPHQLYMVQYIGMYKFWLGQVEFLGQKFAY